ncbi:MAG: hypothetical protein KGI06_01740 [Candidatus Micrarchaeota archaeon]|nr:hypothetical protein [Candidatus Micrarchaeota archaeon]
MKGITKEEPLSKSLKQLRTYDKHLEFFKPTLEGYHYKFSIFLPISEEKVTKGKYPIQQIIFGKTDLDALRKLFISQFKGVTQFRYDITYTKREIGNIPKYILPEMPLPGVSPHILTSPTLKGSWVDENRRPIVNEHAQYHIYTQRHDKAVEYFKDLKEILEKYSKEKVILIEQSEVTILPSISSETRNLLRKVEKLKNDNKRLKQKIKSM